MTILKHKEILPAMLSQIGTVDFQSLVFPEIIELRAELDASRTQDDKEAIAAIEKQLIRYRVTQKHIIVFGVEYLLNLCKANSCQLATRNGQVYIYDGAFWQVVSDGDLKQFLGQALLNMGVEFAQGKYFRFRDDLLSQFYASAHLPIKKSDKGCISINLRNGTLVFGADGVVYLREHRAEDFHCYQLGFDYDPIAKAPLWNGFLNDVQPDAPEVQRLLAEAVALGFLPYSVLKLERIPVLLGTGGNGKSVFTDTVTCVLGRENVSGHSLKLLTGNDNARADLQDKLLNISSEIGGISDSDVFKLLASGEPVTAKKLYQDLFTMTGYGRIMCNANTLPAEVENSPAFFRRFLIIPFNVTIQPGQKDTSLSKKIVETELPGILNWILEGLARLLKQGDFSPCAASDNTLQTYRHESDSVALWLEDAGYKPSNDGHKQPAGVLFSEYRSFCKDEGFSPVGGRVYPKRMKSAGFSQTRTGAGKFYNAAKIGGNDEPF